MEILPLKRGRVYRVANSFNWMPPPGLQICILLTHLLFLFLVSERVTVGGPGHLDRLMPLWQPAKIIFYVYFVTGRPTHIYV